MTDPTEKRDKQKKSLSELRYIGGKIHILVDGTVHDTNQAKPSYQPEREGTYTQEKKKKKGRSRKGRE
jgi:hypothetical protein